MLSPAPAPTTRGWCPTVDAPLEAADGLLLRVRVPGGRLTPVQLRRAAEVVGSEGPHLEITARANLQLRGLAAGQVEDAGQRLPAVGLVVPAPAHDGHRNVMASPTAGLDPSELVDTTPFVTAIAGLLSTTDDVHPKLGVLVDGGGRVHLRHHRQPVDLLAGLDAEGRCWFEVRLQEPSPAVEEPAPLLVPVDDLDAVLAVVGAVVQAHHQGEALRAAVTGVPGVVVDRRITVGIDRTTRSEVPVGIGPDAHGPTWVGGAPLLGRMTAAVAVGLAELAERLGTTDVRLTPWRTVLLAGIAPADTRAALRGLDRLGFATDADDPTLRVTACAGSSGCTEGRADTQVDGRRAVELLRRRPGSNTVHLAGCPKRCGNGRPDATLVSDRTRDRYDLVEPTTTGELVVARDLDVEASLRRGGRW